MSKSRLVPGGAIERLSAIPCPKMRDKQARLWSAFLRRTSISKEAQSGCYIPSSRQWFESLFGNNELRAIKDAAISSGVLQENRSYCAGTNPSIRGDTFPMSYRLAPEFRTGTFEEFVLTRKTKSESAIDVASLGDVGLKLVDRLSLIRLPENAQPASDWDAFNAFNLRNGEIYAMRDDFGWRVHTTVSSLSKKMRRQFESVTKQKLGSIDVRCAQPTIAAGIAAIEAPQTDNASDREIPVNVNDDDFIGFLRSRPLTPFQQLCYKSDLYDYLGKQFSAGRCAQPYTVHDHKNGNVFTATPANWDRESIKKAVALALFGEVDAHMIPSPVFQLLRLDFPDIAEWLVRSKREHGYKHIAQGCQRTEALAMIDGVASEFMDEFPNDPIVTIHDEIIAPVERLDWLRETIEFEFLVRGMAVSTRLDAVS